MELSAEQAEACEIILSILGTSQREAVLQGPAGTGKTVTTAALIRCAQEAGYICAVAAPTHKACGVLRRRLEELGCDVGVSTTHAAAGKRPDPDDKKRLAQGGKPLARNADVLFVDEASMVDSRILSAVRGLPVQHIVWIGDRYQLAPVNDDVSLAFVQQDVVAELREVRRYAESEYMLETTAYLRKCIDRGMRPQLDLVASNFERYMGQERFHGGGIEGLVWLATECEGIVVLGHKNSTIDDVNRRAFMRRHQTDLYEWRKGERVTFQRTYEIAKGYSIKNGAELLIGDAAHDEDQHLWWLLVTDEDNEVTHPVCAYGPHEGSKMAELAKVEKDRKTREALLGPAWMRYQYASTIHKAQGSTMAGAAICWGDIVSAPGKDVARLLYVALTRASEIERLHLVVD